MVSYKDLSDSSKVWIYQCAREFSAAEAEMIKTRGSAFLETWNSHGSALRAAMEVFYNRFIVIFVDENEASASGCSIDTSVHFMKQLEKDLGVSLFDRMRIAYKNEGKISTVHFNEIDKHIIKGEIGEDTIVFNNLVATKKDFIMKWETPLKETWIKDRLAYMIKT
jgi:hypothetical protein